jgi:hypothetical protein
MCDLLNKIDKAMTPVLQRWRSLHDFFSLHPILIR